MRKGKLMALLLLLVLALAVGETYKWVDESGIVHYGDTPPPEIDTQTVVIPEGPSQEDVERERQRVRKLIEQSKEDSPLAPQDQLSQEPKSDASTPDNVVCFSPISDLVTGLSAELYTPITPTTLAKKEQESLNNFLSKIGGRASWRGSISEQVCQGSSSEPEIKFKNFKVVMNADWDVFQSRLTLEIDITGEKTVSKQLIYRFEVGSAFYFNDFNSVDSIALEGNKVELLTLNQNLVSFFIKRRTPTRSGITPLRGEIRYIETSDRTLTLVELYYHNQILTGSRTWVLNR